jgi:hypothetical protein
VDKIYGLLDLVSDAKDAGVTVDYNRDASEVYKAFAINHMQRHGSLDLLYECHRPKSQASTLSLPSWVPDWTLPKLHYNWLAEDLHFRAAKDTIPTFRFDQNVLHVKGVVLDEVEVVEAIRAIPKSAVNAKSNGPTSTTFRLALDSESYVRQESKGTRFWESCHAEYKELRRRNRREWIDNAVAIAFPDGGCTEEAFESLWKTFILGRTDDDQEPPPSYGRAFVEWIASVTSTEEEMKRRIQSERAQSIGLDLRGMILEEDPRRHLVAESAKFGLAQAKCYNRRFFRSAAGRFGWGVDGMKPGDKIVVFYGAGVPFVLRSVDRGQYEIVGDAYLHGKMHGEGIGSNPDGQMLELV